MQSSMSQKQTAVTDSFSKCSQARVVILLTIMCFTKWCTPLVNNGALWGCHFHTQRSTCGMFQTGVFGLLVIAFWFIRVQGSVQAFVLKPLWRFSYHDVKFLSSRESTEVEAAVSIIQLQLIFRLVWWSRSRWKRSSCVTVAASVFSCLFCTFHLFMLVEHCQWCSPWILRGHRHPECCKAHTHTHAQNK